MNFFDKIQNKIRTFGKDVQQKIINLENKKIVFSAISVWIVAFLVIVIVCRMGGSSNVSAFVQETSSSELESTVETSHKAKYVLKDTQSETTTQPVTTQLETEAPTTTEIVTELVKEEVKVETETIAIEKLEVSKTVLKDDVATVQKKVETVATEKAATVSSLQSDNDRLVNCIDISYHQGKIDWAAVKAAGIDYAIIRVGYRGYETGKLGKDVRFDENIQGAINNGIKVGVYFFSQAINEQEAREEASLTLSYIKNYNISLPVIFDWETAAGYRTNCGLDKDKMNSIISTYCDIVKSYGYEPMVYMCKSDFLTRVDASKLSAKYKTWVAWYFDKYDTSNYASNVFKYGDNMPKLSFDYDMWQYTSSGSVNGIKGRVDMNVMILPETKYEVKLEVASSELITNQGVSVDLMKGVSAQTSKGKDGTSAVVLTIYDTEGKEISKETAFSKAGKYLLSYKYSDKDGTVVTKSVTLYVRALPEVFYQTESWSDDSVKTISYTYDETLSEEENYANVEELLNQSVYAQYYERIKGSGKAIKATDYKFEGVEQIRKDGEMQEGETQIIYYVTDGKGLSVSKKINLVINREKSEEAEKTTDMRETEMQTES